MSPNPLCFRRYDINGECLEEAPPAYGRTSSREPLEMTAQSKQLFSSKTFFFLAMETTSRLRLIGVFMIWTPFAANLHPTVKTGTGRSNMKSVCIYVRQKSPQHTHCLRHHHVRPKLIGVHKDESNTKHTYHQEIKRYKYKKLKHISDLHFQS